MSFESHKYFTVPNKESEDKGSHWPYLDQETHTPLPSLAKSFKGYGCQGSHCIVEKVIREIEVSSVLNEQFKLEMFNNSILICEIKAYIYIYEKYNMVKRDHVFY